MSKVQIGDEEDSGYRWVGFRLGMSRIHVGDEYGSD